MATSKIAITIDQNLLHRLDILVKSQRFTNRSRAIQEAVAEKLARMERSRLAQECAKLDPKF
jgi:metal-responsive CopG/Arc/MetJ family transcriptional regulator